MIDMATLFVVVILLSWFLFTHSVDTSKVQQICDAWQLTSLRQLQFSNSSNWIQVTNRHSHSRSAQISSLWPFFFHLFIIIMGFLWKKSLCNLIGIFRNLLITRVEFLFIRSFSWYFAFYMDARNCVVCYIHSRVIIVELRCNLHIIGQINNCHLRLSCHFLHIISAILRNSIRFSEKLKENQMH